MPSSLSLYRAPDVEPHIARRFERYQRAFQVTINGIRYRGHDVSVGGIAFFMSWGGATFAKGQTLSATLHANIEGIYETTHISIQIASFRLDKVTGERVYGCSFQSLAGHDVINMLISGTPPKSADLAQEQKATQIRQVLDASGEFGFLLNLINELSSHAVDEKTSHEEFRVSSAMSLCHIKQCLQNLSAVS